jgi:hypothetical protein
VLDNDDIEDVEDTDDDEDTGELENDEFWLLIIPCPAMIKLLVPYSGEITW